MIQQLQEEFEGGLVHARAADSERLDNTIHGIIDATRNPASKERVRSLDGEIHRVFDAVESASSDLETVGTLELMKGIVLLTSVINAIPQARVVAGGTAADGSQMDLTSARAEDSERLDNTIHGIITATQNPAFKEYLSILDREIHQVFESVEAGTGDAEATPTLELMEGIVVLSGIIHSIAEAKLGDSPVAAVPAAGATDDELQASILHARASDTERLDNTIHGIIENTQNLPFKERLTRLDSEIHRVFSAVEASAGDQETARTLELMQGIVVLSSVFNAIAEARINQGLGQTGDVIPYSPMINVSSAEDSFTVLGAGFDPRERVIIAIAHTVTAAVVVDGSLLSEQISANETGAFQATGTLPLGEGDYTLEATGTDSRLRAVAPVVVATGN